MEKGEEARRCPRLEAARGSGQLEFVGEQQGAHHAEAQAPWGRRAAPVLLLMGHTAVASPTRSSSCVTKGHAFQHWSLFTWSCSTSGEAVWRHPGLLILNLAGRDYRCWEVEVLSPPSFQKAREIHGGQGWC